MPPFGIEFGNSLLILMSDTPASLTLLGMILTGLVTPDSVNITLIYYLEPLWWIPSNSQKLEHLQQCFDHEDTLLNQHPISSPPLHFRQARSLLIRRGLSPNHVHIEAHWQEPELLTRRRTQLSNGAYSSLIVLRHHYNMLFGLLGMTLRQVLNQFGHQVYVHILDKPDSLP